MTAPTHKPQDDWAHAPPGDGRGPLQAHGLDEHLRAVAALAEALAPGPLRALAKRAGLWHDLGKRRPGFQRYIRSAAGPQAHIEGRVADRDKTHSAAGALWAERWFTEHLGQQGLLLSRVLQYVIAGHHAGLDDWHGGLATRLASPEAQRELAEALAQASPADVLSPEGPAFALSDWPIANEGANPGRFALWVRMLFSALVDADFLDTEAYMNGHRAQQRGTPMAIADLQQACTAHLQTVLRNAADTPVNRLRASVLAQCQAKAEHAQGVFTLKVPTGGGKTLSSLAFALEHARQHGLQRVVYAIPYTSIIEQTANVFREVFAALGEDVVLEHHSSAESEPDAENSRSRLACENWDAPLVVTTNVQLFESLFARKTSRCRKLHSLANSVIVLDEAQMLPVDLLQPVVDVLRCLVQDFGVTVVLCTATQPVLDAAAGADPSKGLRRGLAPVVDIIDNVHALYRDLERVRVHLPANLEAPTPWPVLADELATHEAVLTIVSRRADAAELHHLVQQRVGAVGCWHLSALMCAQHRSDAIGAIKAALVDRRHALTEGRKPQPVRVVSTQLVEAGVDLDFPVVYRALAGLDAIAQAAGRCNREGRLPQPGDVHVFVPPTAAPAGLLRQARETCKKVWHDLPAQPLALPLIERYFKLLYHDAPSLDAKGICAMLKLEIDAKALALSVDFRKAAEAFKLIEEGDTATVLVRYRSPNDNTEVNALIGVLKREGPSRWLMRKLQRYGVTLYQHQLRALLKAGDIEEVASCPGLYAQIDGWEGLYDPMLGLRLDASKTEPSHYLA